MADVVHNADGSWHRPPHPSARSAGPSRSNAGLKTTTRRRVNMVDYDAYTAVTAKMLGIDSQQIVDALAADEPTAAQKKLVAARVLTKVLHLGLNYKVRPSTLASKLRLSTTELDKVSAVFARHWPGLIPTRQTKDKKEGQHG